MQKNHIKKLSLIDVYTAIKVHVYTHIHLELRINTYSTLLDIVLLRDGAHQSGGVLKRCFAACKYRIPRIQSPDTPQKTIVLTYMHHIHSNSEILHGILNS